VGECCPAEKEDAFRLADAGRHIEIGTSSFWVLCVGITLLSFGVAIALGRAYPRLSDVRYLIATPKQQQEYAIWQM
jgi:hypothetical protein